VSGASLDDTVEVRVRECGDLEGCIELTRVVHDVDRYPLVLQANLADFLSSPRLIVAWIERRAGPDRCGLPADGLAVGSRPRGRRTLLCTAAAEATGRTSIAVVTAITIG
jgi:hypothetical protein